MGGAGVMGGAQPPACLGGEAFGLKAPLAPLALTPEGPKSAPRLLTLPAGGYALAWLGAGEGGSNYLHAQRLSDALEPIGEPHVFGRAKGAQFSLHATSSGFVVAWINQRSASLAAEGVYFQSFTNDGVARAEPTLLNGSFDATALASGWEGAVGGMLVYARAAGLYAHAFSADAVVPSATSVASRQGRDLGVAFSGASWAVVWREAEADGKATVVFQALSESGAAQGAARRWEDAKVEGRIAFTAGNGLYALAWSAPDTRVFGDAPLIVYLRLLDDSGADLSVLPIDGGEGDMAVSAVSWLNPSLFVVSWHTFATPTAPGALGLSRVNTSGQALPTVLYTPSMGELLAESQVSGIASDALLALTLDPTPSPTGLFSDATRVAVAPVGPCEP